LSPCELEKGCLVLKKVVGWHPVGSRAGTLPPSFPS